ncbi:MAG: glycoside hydrolase family 2 TIM barrel-domain containing protein [Bacteroidota bacterium]
MRVLYVILVSSLFCFSCEKPKDEVQKPSKVDVRSVNGQFNFYVNDTLFQLKGLGFNYEYRASFEELSKTGANAIRTWSTTYADTILKAAEKYDLMVAMGISIGKELWGFDYNDTSAVANQFENVKSIINTYKDHPNLLCWVVGNELNLLFEDDGTTLRDVNPKVYDAMADVIDYIHEVDPNHPVTMTFAGVIAPHLKVALERVPQLDILSVQVYADLEHVEKRIKDAGITKPYMVTEFGPRGFWEIPKTEWNREIEEPSGPKADGIIERIDKGLINNASGKCLGGFAFVWGQKHERTPTWYGMHHDDGRQTEYLDNLIKLWTGKYPENRAPRVDKMLLDGKHAQDNIYLEPNTVYDAKVIASDIDGDQLSYKWEVAHEVDVRSLGGEKEQKPKRLQLEVLKDTNGDFTFKSPEEEGEYRILVYVYDGKHKAGNANIPFYVKNK